MKRAILIAACLAAAAALAIGWQYWGPGRAPAGQPELAELTAQALAELRGDFNAAAGQTRVVALLSPT